ncbi:MULTISPECIES: DUF2383 domain-containing protein [unclassified Paenibacillus]|uniref:DUF2383 domain-containing protein n=1 Tax=unclassified Paenibacillus TaxID=185978 RepID=UPI001C117C64|nr:MULTISPECIES: DUF2383 domain-containing protein [unclassified Paenibacillus]MBU5442292.1 PA2169 family four-helix-bundle protein [Paenibacillus sp. MSJ-34]CAH0121235.1 hypothetical protein PAE9249_03761 [Paenibacillus sp. CECT 9249]
MDQVIDKLNEFLKGNHMAIHAYEEYIQRVKDGDAKKLFQRIQQEHKRHAILLAERIQNLGGVPVDGVGLKGAAIELMKKLQGASDDTFSILQDAAKGEEVGIKIGKEVVKGDLDPESLAMVKRILDADQNHVEALHAQLQNPSPL